MPFEHHAYLLRDTLLYVTEISVNKYVILIFLAYKNSFQNNNIFRNI